MPVTKSASKALRRDRHRTAVNQTLKARVRSSLQKANQNLSTETLNLTYSVLDKAVKKNLIHKNKAARLKSTLAHKK